MVHVSGGRATAAAIPGAELILVDGMGHDLPPALFDTFADGIRRTADRRRAREGPEAADRLSGRRQDCRLLAQPLAGVGVEDVHVVRVGRDVDRVALVDAVAGC